MSKIFHPRGLKELLWKAGRSTETTTFRRLIKKYPGSSGTKAYTIAQQKGLRKIQSLGKRFKVEGLGASQGIKKRFKKFKPSGILRTGSFNLNSLTLKSLAINLYKFFYHF